MCEIVLLALYKFILVFLGVFFGGDLLLLFFVYFTLVVIWGFLFFVSFCFVCMFVCLFVCLFVVFLFFVVVVVCLFVCFCYFRFVCLFALFFVVLLYLGSGRGCLNYIFVHIPYKLNRVHR